MRYEPQPLATTDFLAGLCSDVSEPRAHRAPWLTELPASATPKELVLALLAVHAAIPFPPSEAQKLRLGILDIYGLLSAPNRIEPDAAVRLGDMLTGRVDNSVLLQRGHAIVHDLSTFENAVAFGTHVFGRCFRKGEPPSAYGVLCVLEKNLHWDDLHHGESLDLLIENHREESIDNLVTCVNERLARDNEEAGVSIDPVALDALVRERILSPCALLINLLKDSGRPFQQVAALLRGALPEYAAVSVETGAKRIMRVQTALADYMQSAGAGGVGAATDPPLILRRLDNELVRLLWDDVPEFRETAVTDPVRTVELLQLMMQDNGLIMVRRLLKGGDPRVIQTYAREWSGEIPTALANLPSDLQEQVREALERYAAGRDSRGEATLTISRLGFAHSNLLKPLWRVFMASALEGLGRDEEAIRMIDDWLSSSCANEASEWSDPITVSLVESLNERMEFYLRCDRVHLALRRNTADLDGARIHLAAAEAIFTDLGEDPILIPHLAFERLSLVVHEEADVCRAEGGLTAAARAALRGLVQAEKGRQGARVRIRGFWNQFPTRLPELLMAELDGWERAQNR